MAKLPKYGNGTLTWDNGNGVTKFEVIGNQHSIQRDPWTEDFQLTLPHVRPLSVTPHNTQENISTEEEKAQRTLAEYAGNITRKFREAERGLLEEADLKRREERDREDRNNKRRSAIKQAMNAAFDAGLYEDDLAAVLPDHCRDAFDKLREEIETNIDLDNLFEAV